MIIFVDYGIGEILAIQVKSFDSIESVKQKIEYMPGILVREQCLIFGYKYLENNKSISYYGIHENITVHLVVHFCGC